MSPLASIIIPTYKRPQQLETTLRSLAAQSISKDSFEVIIVDNSETPSDHIQSLVSSTPELPLIYIHEPANGLHNARHAGALNAQSPILVYIDDDVICPECWLHEMILAFDDPSVHAVGGKVELKYQGAPPPWIDDCEFFLSAYNRGDEAHILPHGESLVGCNMAVRKDSLFAVGGFNPDGFGDSKLLLYRGDGECGLTRKLQSCDMEILYSPSAFLYHIIPSSRVTIDYFKKRAHAQGLEQIYIYYRYSKPSLPRMLLFLLKLSKKCLTKYIKRLLCSSYSPKWYHLTSALTTTVTMTKQLARLLLNKDLRHFIAKESYLTIKS